ncbi:hypothetical protein AX16_006947 [Volvariella volvacea WC 439]|nr:hypothetical protein AX16_006947 [Volvariella volvacea WC 439]
MSTSTAFTPYTNPPILMTPSGPQPYIERNKPLLEDEEEDDKDEESIPQPRNPLPGFGLPLNYVPKGFRFPNATDIEETRLSSRALPPLMFREITMLQVMNLITDKPGWNKKVFDEVIVATWTREALADRTQDITPAMMAWCIHELRYRARIYEQTGCVAVYNGDVVKSDIAVPPEVGDELREAVKSLEDVPDKDKDWHPGSDGKVLDLVHPSLYPLVYGRTRVLEDGLTSLENFVERCGEGRVAKVPKKKDVEQETLAYYLFRPHTPYSRRFQWLPCEVKIWKGEEGKINSKITSYVNNLHPAKHGKLYNVIERVISCAIPLWNKTLTPLKNGSRQSELISLPRISYTTVEYVDEMPEGDYSDENRILAVPDALEWKEPQPSQIHPTEVVDLVKDYGDKGLQVIVKLANIHLTPEKPTYEGGSWHVEGQLNEHICATALYYYDNENIEPSHLAFRQQSDHHYIEQVYYSQDHHRWVGELYGLPPSTAAVQTVGSVETREGRLLTFPNILQHQVQPFKLSDPTKPGHRKILALFLVDPNIRVISSANVPCRRRDWWSEEVLKDGMGVVGNDGKVKDLPVELQQLVVEKVEEFPIGMEEAKNIRLELMEERKVFVMEYGKAFTIIKISLCEH